MDATLLRSAMDASETAPSPRFTTAPLPPDTFSPFTSESESTTTSAPSANESGWDDTPSPAPIVPGSSFPSHFFMR